VLVPTMPVRPRRDMPQRLGEASPSGSTLGGSSWAKGSSLSSGTTWLRRGEALWVKRLLAGEHVVDGPSELVSEDGQRLGLAVLALEALEDGAALFGLGDEEDGRFGEGPLEVGVVTTS
jgi:hypothetical protein